MYTKGQFRGKKITIMGLGLLGRGIGDAAFFAREGANVLVTDLKTKKELKESIDQLSQYTNIHYVLGEHRLEDFEHRDFIVKAAGVPMDSPYIEHARKHNVPVYMSTALFASLTPATIVGITGTRGKTTVTHLVYEALRKHLRSTKKKVYLGGNIKGMSTIELLPKTKKGDIVVLELDSWQLQGFGDLGISPKYSVFTTFMPDHLNYYKHDLERYFSDKAFIFEAQKKSDVIIAREQICSLPTAFTKRFPRQTKFVSEKMLPKTIRLRIPGEHNRYNAAVACALLRTLKVPVKNIVESFNVFRGVSGRLQEVLSRDGITIYNDTTATTPHALFAALEALSDRPISLIMGGADKDIDISILKEPLAQACVSIALLAGNGTDRLMKEGILPNHIKTPTFSSFEKSVKYALAHTPKGGVLLLSPGFASFGMFKNEYDRGEQFNKLVKKLLK